MNNNAWLIPQNSCSMEQFFVTLGTFQKLNGVQRDKNIQQVLSGRRIACHRRQRRGPGHSQTRRRAARRKCGGRKQRRQNYIYGQLALDLKLIKA